MSFLGLSRGPSKKASSNIELLGFDLLYQLTYLSAIASAGIPRSQLFRLAADLPSIIAPYFDQVDRMARSMNYEYSEACRLVAEQTDVEEIRSLMLRLSNALATGESESEFMNNEAHVQAELYGNAYERSLDSMKKWTDSYIALQISAALIIVVAAVSTVIYDMGTAFMTGLPVVTVLINGLGAWVIWRSAPKEVKILKGPYAETSQRLANRMFVTFVPLSIVVVVISYLMGMSVGWIIAVVGVTLLPIGLVSRRLDSAVNKKDADITTFLRTLGAITSAIGTTVTEALGRLETRSMPSLIPDIRRLHNELGSRMAPEMTWVRFVSGTGSELINRGVGVLLGGLRVGAEPGEVGNRASLLTLSVSLLRSKRNLVASSFKGLSLAMHVTVVFLLTFIIDIVAGFGGLVSSIEFGFEGSEQAVLLGSQLSFGFGNTQFLKTLTIPVIIALSIFNAATSLATEGGYSRTFFFYLTLTFIASGLSMVIAPVLAKMIFGIVPESF